MLGCSVFLGYDQNSEGVGLFVTKATGGRECSVFLGYDQMSEGVGLFPWVVTIRLYVRQKTNKKTV